MQLRTTITTEVLTGAGDKLASSVTTVIESHHGDNPRFIAAEFTDHLNRGAKVMNHLHAVAATQGISTTAELTVRVNLGEGDLS